MATETQTLCPQLLNSIPAAAGFGQQGLSQFQGICVWKPVTPNPNEAGLTLFLFSIAPPYYTVISDEHQAIEDVARSIKN
jgi:hypothetical protein